MVMATGLVGDTIPERLEDGNSYWASMSLSFLKDLKMVITTGLVRAVIPERVEVNGVSVATGLIGNIIPERGISDLEASMNWSKTEIPRILVRWTTNLSQGFPVLIHSLHAACVHHSRLEGRGQMPFKFIVLNFSEQRGLCGHSCLQNPTRRTGRLDWFDDHSSG